jgi:hypothetical protein
MRCVRAGPAEAASLAAPFILADRMCLAYITKPDVPGTSGLLKNTPGSDLLSHTPTDAVPSAVAGLTSVFGMGTGVTLPL